MKYIRTKYEIMRIDIEIKNELPVMIGVHTKECEVGEFQGIEVLKQANTIEELCNEFVVEDNYDFAIFSNLKLAMQTKGTCYGAIWTDKGLIYVAKMNDKGELELL